MVIALLVLSILALFVIVLKQFAKAGNLQKCNVALHKACLALASRKGL